MDNERCSEGSEAGAAVEGRHSEGTVKDAGGVSDRQNIGWLPGWNLSGLAHLTGAMTSTVN